MANPTTIPRFLLPHGVPRTLTFQIARNARTSSSSRCISNKTSPEKNKYVLPQPDKFRPPSHSARRATRQPRYYGPTLTPEQKEEQKTKRYPHMMPPKGTFMHWFIHNRGIHVWIACGTLFSLAGIMFIENFKRTSPFADMLPPPRQLLTSPLTFISQWLDIYKLHTEHVSAEVAERRRRKIDDVQKRSEYRKAHGLEDSQEGGSAGALFGWTARDKAPKEEGHVDDASPVNPFVAGGVRSDEYVDFDGKRRPVKKWLGIW